MNDNSLLLKAHKALQEATAAAQDGVDLMETFVEFEPERYEENRRLLEESSAALQEIESELRDRGKL